MATSEIEKLERRYAENPHGLTFAPLAEVYRKNGDVPRALELLRAGLELHPNYIPASIVLGRCHQDLGDLPAAEQAFAHVLRLDDENVIALKSLADINERQDRLDEAAVWLHRLVAVDRSNDEARQQLRRLEALKESGSRAATPPAPASEVPQEAALASDEPPPSPVVTETVAAAPESADLEPLDLTDEIAASAPPREEAKPVEQPVAAQPEPAAPEVPASQKRMEASEPSSPATREEEPPTLAGLISSEFQPPRGPPSEPIGLEIETENDVVLRSSGAAEFSVPDASEDLAALAAKLNASRPRSPGRRATDRSASERLAAQAEALAKAKAQAEALAQAKAQAEARAQAEAEAEAEAGSKRNLAAPPPQPEPRAEPVAAPSVAYGASETRGQSIAAFFQALLVARPPADPGTPTSAASGEGGAATRPAEDALSLSPGFREGSAPMAPPVATSGPAKDAGVSFDDFFGASADGSTRTPGSAEPGKDDLDQFHSWLQNLKR
jgi:tetratricopeptide (TPR) repeat protein